MDSQLIEFNRKFRSSRSLRFGVTAFISLLVGCSQPLVVEKQARNSVNELGSTSKVSDLTVEKGVSSTAPSKQGQAPQPLNDSKGELAAQKVAQEDKGLTARKKASQSNQSPSSDKVATSSKNGIKKTASPTKKAAQNKVLVKSVKPKKSTSPQKTESTSSISKPINRDTPKKIAVNTPIKEPALVTNAPQPTNTEVVVQPNKPEDSDLKIDLDWTAIDWEIPLSIELIQFSKQFDFPEQKDPSQLRNTQEELEREDVADNDSSLSVSLGEGVEENNRLENSERESIIDKTEVDEETEKPLVFETEFDRDSDSTTPTVDDLLAETNTVSFSEERLEPNDKEADEVIEQKLLIDEQEGNLQTYVRIREGNINKLVSVTQVPSEEIQDRLYQVLLLQWNRVVPTIEQSTSSRFQYCLGILDDLRGQSYELFIPYTLAAEDYQQWRQQLGDLSLVQLAGASLDIYPLHIEGGGIFAISTHFEVNPTLITVVPGVGYHNPFFTGLVAFGQNNQESLGGAGRFFPKETLQNIEWFLILWQDQIYGVKVERLSGSPHDLEIIPLLYQQQQVQRNCRWQR